MEKTKKAATVPLDAGWSDLGSWSVLWSSMEKCKNNNASQVDVVLEQSQNCLAISEHRLVTVLGMKDSIVVETADSVLVADLEHVQDIKKVVQKLKSEHRTEASEHRQGFRPWGMYDCIDKGYRFQVKRITVKPGETLSLQMHHHRAEHWVVVSGTATVRCGDKTTLLTENQSTYIPLGELHKLSNPGKCRVGTD
jgi:mannose-1-phosphate guanylyltransferase